MNRAVNTSRLSTVSKRDAMPVISVLKVVAAMRPDDAIVVTNQASARLWPHFSQHQLDFNYNPSTMSGAIPLALGFSIAQPDRQVVVLSGDGSLLMSLGCLVTVMASGVNNLTILLMDNGVYEVTGGQRTPASRIDVNYAALAGACGIPSIFHITKLDDWERLADRLFTQPGPRFVWLQVETAPLEFLSRQVENSRYNVLNLGLDVTASSIQ